MGERKLGKFCLNFNSDALTQEEVGWKAYNIAMMFKNKNFIVPFGFIIPTKVYEEKIKNEIIDTLIYEFKKKIEEYGLFKKTVEDFMEGENIEEIISQRKVNSIFKLLSKMELNDSGYGPDAIISKVTKKFPRKFKNLIETHIEILDEVKEEISHLESNAIFIRSSSNIDQNILKEYPGAFKSVAMTKSYLKEHQNVIITIFSDIYLSLLNSYATPDIFMKQPFEDSSMAILFQEKETPIKSGIGKCDIKKEGGKAKLYVTIEAYEGELIVSIKGKEYQEKAPYINFNPDIYSIHFECKKIYDKFSFSKNLSEEKYEKGRHTAKLMFDLDLCQFIPNLASIENEILTLKERKELYDMIVDAFDFWEKQKPDLFEQRIEFLISLPSNTLCLIQCDNHIEG
jgi:hypothetical protein